MGAANRFRLSDCPTIRLRLGLAGGPAALARGQLDLLALHLLEGLLLLVGQGGEGGLVRVGAELAVPIAADGVRS